MIGDEILPNRYCVKLFLALTLGMSACALAVASTPPTLAPGQTTTPGLTAPLRDLSLQQIRNAEYRLGTSDDHAVVQLSDGKYQRGADLTTLDFVSVFLSDFVSFGDLKGDGMNAAAAMFFENYGGTGNFGLLAIYTNVNGLPVFLTSTLIDDRPIINRVSIENGEVYLDATVHGFEDPGCCPQLPTTRRFALVNNQLRLTNYTATTPAGVQRIIEISSPANGTETSGSVQLSGNVSIAPFENNLTYSIFAEAGNQIAVGPVTVTAPDLGAPGTFIVAISLAGIPAGTTIYLEIQDISAADGSLLALDVVELFVK